MAQAIARNVSTTIAAIPISPASEIQFIPDPTKSQLSVEDMFTYTQTHPRMLLDGKPLLGAPLYSGHGFGLNNPALEAEPDIGPIPSGEWRIDRWDDHHADKGPIVAVLEPVGHDAHGRTGFLIHGAHADDHFDSSHGCVVASLAIRTAMRDSGQTQLFVTSGE